MFKKIHLNCIYNTAHFAGDSENAYGIKCNAQQK